MAKKQPRRPAVPRQGQGHLYTVRAGALPELTSAEPGALRFLDLTLDDLYLLRDLYQGLRDGRDLKVLAPELGVGRNKCYDLLAALPGAGARNGGRSYVRKLRHATNPAALPEVAFHDGLRCWLEEFIDLLHRCQRGCKAVRVQGADFSIQWLLPRVLRHSDFLRAHPDVELNISHGSWQELLQNLAHDRIDLSIGPEVPPERRPAGVEAEPLLTINRALIYHPDDQDLADRVQGPDGLGALRSATVFVLSGDMAPTFSMRQSLPPPKPPGRWVLLDSISRMYAYVKQGLGVALGFEKKYGLSDPGKDRSKALVAVELPNEQLPPARVYLYFRAGRALRPEVCALANAVREWAPRVS